MCLITEQKTPLIAQKDMRVYKILKEDLISPYQYFQYEQETLYKRKIMKSSEWTAFDSVCSSYLSNHFPGWRSTSVKELKCIGRGIHSARTKKRLQNTMNKRRGEKIFRCTIPKGSEYYLDGTGLCVSNQIIIH